MRCIIIKDKRKDLINAKRIVIKIGTSILTHETGNINLMRVERLARVISDLLNMGKEIILVSSGAIGVGVGKLKLSEKPKTLGEKQAVAAVGQCELMHIYSKLFADYGHIVGQILLTRDVIEDQKMKNNVLNTFNNLIKRRIVPIVNENDSVSIEEIEIISGRTFGDNDTLSAIVSRIVSADLLVILSDVDGVYNLDPRKDKSAKLISTINKITPQIERCGDGVGTERGTGGMEAKLAATKIAMSSGIKVVICNGENPDIILDILHGKDKGTFFSEN